MNDLPDNEYERIRDLYLTSVVIPTNKPEQQSLLCPVGYIGAGKSTVTVPLAERLGFVRVSSDEIRKLLKENNYTYARTKEMAAGIISEFLDGGYSVAIDANCGSPEILDWIKEQGEKRFLKIFWIHVNPPEEFIVNKLRNYPHTWLFANGEQAVQNSLGRKKELGDLSNLVPYIYTFDTSKPNLSEQLKEAEALISK